jgi:DNA-binding protein H-NS
MSKLQELLAQQAKLDLEIAELRKSDLATAIASAKALIAEHGLTSADLFSTGKVRSAGKEKAKVPAKYRDPLSGLTWSGRGIEPRWLKGKDRNDYKIDSLES